MPLDARKVDEQIWNAIYDLQGIEDDLRKPVLLFVKGALTEPKARLAWVAHQNYLSTYRDIPRLARDKGFAVLPPKTQAMILWYDKVHASMAAMDGDFDMSWKLLKKGAAGQEAKILKQAKAAVKEVRTPPKTMARLVKHMVQGGALSPAEEPMHAMIPLCLTAWAVADRIDEGLAQRPRG